MNSEAMTDERRETGIYATKIVLGLHLTVESVLEYYDGPILFIAEDEAEEKYLCTFLRHLTDSSEYLCSRITPSSLRKFLAGGVDLLDAITKAKLPRNYLLTVHHENAEDAPLIASFITGLDQLGDRLLPKEGYYVPPEIGSPLLSPQFAAINAALEIEEARAFVERFNQD